MAPSPLTFMGWLSATARHDPGRVALIDSTVTVTYGELVESARAVAAGLADAGLARRVPVALACEPSASYLTLFLGALEAGVVPAFINTRLTPYEVRAFLERIKPQAVVSDAAYTALVKDAGLPLITVPGRRGGGTLREQLEPVYGTPASCLCRTSPTPRSSSPLGGLPGCPRAATRRTAGCCCGRGMWPPRPGGTATR